MRNRCKVLLVTLGIGFAAIAAAQIPYSATGGFWNQLGWDGSTGGDFDRLWLGDNSGSTMGLAKAGTFTGVTAIPSTQYLEDWFFEVGINSSSAHTDLVSFTQSLTVNSITQSFTLAGNIEIDTLDRLTVADSATLYFNLGGGTQLKFKALGFSTGWVPVGTASGVVNAEVSLVPVPEPFTMALGAASLGLGLRRRLRKNA